MFTVPELPWPVKPEAAKLVEEKELNHPSSSFWLLGGCCSPVLPRSPCASLQMTSVLASGGGQGWDETISTERKRIREAGGHCHVTQPHSHAAAPMGAHTITIMSWPDASSPVKIWRMSPGCHRCGGMLIHLFSPLHILLLSTSQYFPSPQLCFPAKDSAVPGVKRSPSLSQLSLQSPPWGSQG